MKGGVRKRNPPRRSTLGGGGCHCKTSIKFYVNFTIKKILQKEVEFALGLEEKGFRSHPKSTTETTQELDIQIGKGIPSKRTSCL